MVWETTTPAFVAQMRTQLGLSTSWVAAIAPALYTARAHFPSFNPGGMRETVDALPAVLICRPKNARKKWIEGASGLIAGSIDLIFYFPALTEGIVPGYKAGQIETLIETIVGELIAQPSGIPFTDDATIGAASDPTDPEIAADTAAAPAAFRTCLVTMPYGYTP